MLGVVEMLEREHPEIGTSSQPQSLINRMSERDTIQSPMIETLQVLEAAVDGLHRLGIAIRQSPSTDLDQRITSFIERRADWNMQPLFLVRLKVQLIDRVKNQHNPGAPLSLCKHLASSISFRYFRILYLRSHQTKLETRREAAPVPAVAVGPSNQRTSAPVHNQSPAPRRGGLLSGLNAKFQRPSPVVDNVSESLPTLPHSKKVLEVYEKPKLQKSTPDTISQVSVRFKNAKYPDPPETKSIYTQVACPYCTKLLDASLLRNKIRWE